MTDDPPTETVFRRADFWAYGALSLLITAAIVQFGAYWFTLDAWGRHPVSFTLMTVLLAGNLSFPLVSWALLPRMRRPVPVAPPQGLRVGVATTFVPGLESLDMLEETLRSLVAMRYPHETWVLDEGDDIEVRILCQRLGAHHFSRAKLDAYQAADGPFEARTKHGNVNAWLTVVAYDRFDIVASFDPDHVPKPEFLERVLGYFEDEEVGYVQAAQVYYNQAASFIARGAAEETYAYYSSLQMASASAGYPIVTGCHNTHRVLALREVGGFAPHDADDLLITLNYRSAGWRGVYVPEILARGITPVDWRGYLRQQLRWARSVLDIKLRIFPRLASGLPLQTRLMSLLHGSNYVLESLFSLVGLGLLAWLLAAGNVPLLSYMIGPQLLVMIAVLFGAEFFRQRFFLDRKNEWGLHWRAGILRYAKGPWVMRALIEVILDRRVPYTLTEKVTISRGRTLALWPHWVIGLGIASAWVGGYFGRGIVYPSLHVFAGIIIGISLGLALSELKRFPEPFDAELLNAARRRGELPIPEVVDPTTDERRPRPLMGRH